MKTAQGTKALCKCDNEEWVDYPGGTPLECYVRCIDCGKIHVEKYELVSREEVTVH